MDNLKRVLTPLSLFFCCFFHSIFIYFNYILYGYEVVTILHNLTMKGGVLNE
nr:MAG TPA: hypothetical protein [Caudoviricetes sp.]